MGVFVVEKMYNKNDEMIVVDEMGISKGYYFGKSESILIDRKIDTDEFVEYINKNGKVIDFLNEKGINYYSLYTESCDYSYDGVNPYKSIWEIEKLEKEYPYYLNLDGGINDIRLYDNKDILIQNEEIVYFTYSKNNKCEIIEIEDNLEELQLIAYGIKRQDTYQIDLYKNKDKQYITVCTNFYPGYLNYVEEYDITPKELKEKYDCIVD